MENITRNTGRGTKTLSTASLRPSGTLSHKEAALNCHLPVMEQVQSINILLFSL